MGGKKVRLTVSSPDNTVINIDADFVLLRTVTGDMGVLWGHESCATMLDYGLLRAYTEKKMTDILTVMGGFALIDGKSVSVITKLAEHPDRIAEAIAGRERERAESKKRERLTDAELQRAEVALRHTLVDLDISSFSIIKGRDEKLE